LKYSPAAQPSESPGGPTRTVGVGHRQIRRPPVAKTRETPAARTKLAGSKRRFGHAEARSRGIQQFANVHRRAYSPLDREFYRGTPIFNYVGLKTMKSIAVILAAAVLAGCATRANDVAPAYVSPLTYDRFSCDQLRDEATRVSSRAIAATGAQNRRATNDAVATGVTLILFWPAVFLVRGDGAQAAELARLKGEMDAIEQASTGKGCGIEFNREPQTYATPVPEPV